MDRSGHSCSRILVLETPGSDPPVASLFSTVAAHLAKPFTQRFGKIDHATLNIVIAVRVEPQSTIFFLDLRGNNLSPTLFRGVLQVLTQTIDQIEPTVAALKSVLTKRRERAVFRCANEDQGVSLAQQGIQFGTQFPLLVLSLTCRRNVQSLCNYIGWGSAIGSPSPRGWSQLGLHAFVRVLRVVRPRPQRDPI